LPDICGTAAEKSLKLPMEFPGNGGMHYQVYCSGAVTKSVQEL
jgi:hypothetical protein